MNVSQIVHRKTWTSKWWPTAQAQRDSTVWGTHHCFPNVWWIKCWHNYCLRIFNQYKSYAHLFLKVLCFLPAFQDCKYLLSSCKDGLGPKPGLINQCTNWIIMNKLYCHIMYSHKAFKSYLWEFACKPEFNSTFVTFQNPAEALCLWVISIQLSFLFHISEAYL